MPNIPANETNLLRMMQEALSNEQRFPGDIVLFLNLLRNLEETGVLEQFGTTIDALFRVALEEAKKPDRTEYSSILAAFNVLEARLAFGKELQLLNSFYNFVLSQDPYVATYVEDYIANVHTFDELTEYLSAVASSLDVDTQSLKKRSVELFGTILPPGEIEKLFRLRIKFASNLTSLQSSEDD